MPRRHQRDTKGRFKPGSRSDPGNPQVRRLGELQAAVREAAEPPIIQGEIKRLAKLALDARLQRIEQKQGLASLRLA